MTGDASLIGRPAVRANTVGIMWTPEAEAFCKRLATKVVANVPDKARPVFKAYREDEGGTSIDLGWVVGDDSVLSIGWTLADRTDLNADLTPRRGFIEIDVVDNTDAVLLAQRVVDLVLQAREAIQQRSAANA